MVVPSPPKLMTTEELLALPDDGMERWLINGVLHEKYPEIIDGKPVTVHNRFHSSTLANAGSELHNWLHHQPPPHGVVLGGEVGVILRRNPDVTVGIDVVYVSHEVWSMQSDTNKLFEGIPVLAVEILAPSDTVGEIHDKRNIYLEHGVSLVWMIDPSMQTVTAYSRGIPPRLFNIDDELTAEPFLPGFRTPVARFFE